MNGSRNTMVLKEIARLLESRLRGHIHRSSPEQYKPFSARGKSGELLRQSAKTQEFQFWEAPRRTERNADQRDINKDKRDLRQDRKDLRHDRKGK
jgi:hypothetical protein